MNRAGIGSAALVVWTTLASWTFAAESKVDEVTTGFFRRHCVRCHGEKKAQGGLRLDQLDGDLARRDTYARWHAAAAKLRAGDMPPEGEPRPDSVEVATVVRRITQRLDQAAAQRSAEGRVVLRRLNRTEYENTVRDLFAVAVDVKAILPEDTIAYGFDNVGSALNVSPVLLERYLEAADAVIAAAAAPVAKMEPRRETHMLADSLPSYYRGAYYRDGEVVLFRSEGSPSFLAKFRARETGNYRFRIAARAYQSEAPLTIALLVGNFNTAAGSARHIGYYDVPPGELRPIEVEARLLLRETIKVQPVALPRVYVRQENFPEYPGPGLAVGAIEVEGPLPEAWPTESHRRIYGDADPKSGTAADAEKVLRGLLPRAFRRPITDEDLRPYLRLVADALGAGKPFDKALHGGIKAVLCSPKFLYLREGVGAASRATPGESPARLAGSTSLDDFALATRLSYFLWSSLPDDELFDLAGRGELKKPDVLRSQTERMLNDPKGNRFIDNFTGQWLSLRDIEFTTPDRQLYPEFDELLQWSMVRETQLFFEELLRNDLSVLNFIDSDFTLVNNRLAQHYGIEGVEGVSFRKVPLRPEHHRGGVLGQASVLKVTANGTTTSPVVRGVWVMDRLMGQPAKPPPANVPAIEPDIRGAVTIREQLVKHRAIESCAACHARIDPPGFALENYDVIGGWRQRYRALGTRERAPTPPSPLAKYLAKPGYGLGPAVDAGDVLPDGRRFRDVAEFEQLLLADPDQFVRCLTEKLLIYATGAGLEYGDDAQVQQIVSQARDQGHGLRSLVHLVVGSELFRNK